MEMQEIKMKYPSGYELAVHMTKKRIRISYQFDGCTENVRTW